MVKSLAAFICTITIMLSSPGLSNSAEQTSKETLDVKAAILNSMHMKATRDIVKIAQDDVFQSYFLEKNESKKAKIKTKIEKKMHTIQAKYHVDEMCVIAEDGRELARVVFDKIAPDSDLSDDESGAPFFAPSFEASDRRSHIEKPYISADSERWVIAYTSPIVLNGDKKPAFIHYEMPLTFYYDELKKDLPKGQSVLIIDNDGVIWADTRKDIKIAADPEKGKVTDNFSKLDAPKKMMDNFKHKIAGKGKVTLDGKDYSIEYKPLKRFNWTIAVIKPL